MIEDRDVTASEAAAIFGISIKVIYKWKCAHMITPVDVLQGPGRPVKTGNRGGSPLYRLSEIASLVADRHARSQNAE